MSKPWKPKWTVKPAPKDDDEEEVIAMYVESFGLLTVKPWDELEEWQRESWRREYRDL